MAIAADILVVGGGIAGLSAAALLSHSADVVVLEAEAQIGFHASGRSATMLHYALGDLVVRALTLASRSFFDSPPAGFGDAPLGRTMPVLVHAREEERAALDQLEAEIAPFARLERVDGRGIADLCPLLKVGPGGAQHALVDHDGLRLDPHALLQGFARQLKANHGTVCTSAAVAGAERRSGAWNVITGSGERYTAPILVNAAGAWADTVARIAGVSAIGLQPLRRTIITFHAPGEVALDRLPFAKTVGDDLYFAPESGRLFASPMDEVPSDACDAQPGEYEIALAAARMEERTHVQVTRVHARWAGLRTFAPDRLPVVGFAPDAEGFFWLAGQGGAGLQTSPAIAGIVAALIGGLAWPAETVTAQTLSPRRFFP